jgi:DNA-binding transcriptional MerR regulator
VEKAPDAFRTISEVAEDLDLPQHVLRFWETRFGQIKPMKRGGGRRYYRPEDVDLLRGIRHLLYGEGYTIRGVQRILKDEGIKFVQSVWRAGAPQPERSPTEEPQEAAARPALTRPLPGRGAHHDPETERGRGLFGLLPSLLGSGLDDGDGLEAGQRTEPRIEPSIEDIFAELPPLPLGELPGESLVDAADSNGPVPQTKLFGGGGEGVPTGPAIAPEDFRRLQATLHELGECRRLLETALVEQVG